MYSDWQVNRLCVLLLPLMLIAPPMRRLHHTHFMTLSPNSPDVATNFLRLKMSRIRATKVLSRPTHSVNCASLEGAIYRWIIEQFVTVLVLVRVQ